MKSTVDIDKKTPRMCKQSRSPAVEIAVSTYGSLLMITPITILSHVRGNVNKMVT